MEPEGKSLGGFKAGCFFFAGHEGAGAGEKQMRPKSAGNVKGWVAICGRVLPPSESEGALIVRDLDNTARSTSAGDIETCGCCRIVHHLSPRSSLGRKTSEGEQIVTEGGLSAASTQRKTRGL